jgi:hypothetical protein
LSKEYAPRPCDEPWRVTKARDRDRDGSIASGGIIARNPLVTRLIWFVDRSEDVGSLFFESSPRRYGLHLMRHATAADAGNDFSIAGATTHRVHRSFLPRP